MASQDSLSHAAPSPAATSAAIPPPPLRSTSLHSSPRPPEPRLQLHRGHSDGSGALAASSTAAAGQNPREGETWMDFLRDDDDAGREVQRALGQLTQRSTPDIGHHNSFMEAQAALVAARKRRLADMAERADDRQERWTSAGEPSAMLGRAGDSSSHPIDLTDGQQPDAQAGDEALRAGSIVIPGWQPDVEVSQCPVCGTSFSFWYRKHHCRKCGRVVCAHCSPHRITIPRQYIVHPPDEMRLPREPPDDDADPAAATNPALGGGEEVRVCNPCVPDPNFAPPPQLHSASDARPFAFDPARSRDSSDARGHARNLTFDFTLPPHRRNSSQGQPHTPRNRPARTSSLSSPQQDPFSPRYSAARPGFSNPFSSSSPFPAFHSGQHRANSASIYHHMYYPSTETPSQSRPHSQSHTATRPTRTPSSSRPTADDGRPALPQLPRRQPRPEIPEEDECPICFEELPPKAPDGGTEARERHVEDCIASNMAGSGGGGARSRAAQSAAVHASAMNPGDAGAGAAVEASRSEGPAGSAAVAGSSSSPLPTPPVSAVPVPTVAEGSSRRRRTTVGMLKYRATEKDCVDEGGQPAECVICFEEFEVGDEMGRLECFCKFHRSCIRQWWNTKGDGCCPTHQGSVVLG